MYKVQVTPLIGLPRFDGWAHVTTISSGTIVFALSVEGQHARNIGRDLVDVINQDTSISSGAQLYKLVTKLIQDAEDKEGKLSLACGLLVQEAKSTFCVFNAAITLKRDGKSGQLLQSTDSLQIIEGKTQLADSYVFSTNQANQFLGEVRQKFDQGFDSDTIVTSITPSLHLEETTATSAMAFVDFRDTTQVKPLISQVSQEPQEPVIVPVLEKEVSAAEKQPLTQSENEEVIVDADQEILETLVKTEQVINSSKPQTNKLQNNKRFKVLLDYFQAFKSTSATAFSSVLENLKKVSAWRPPVAGEVYVGQENTTKKMRAWFGIGLIVVLLAAAGGIFAFQRSKNEADVTAMLEPFLTQIQEVSAQVEENPIEARQNLQKIVAEMESLEASLEDNKTAQKRVTLSLEDARKLYDEISGKEVFSELSIFFNSRDQEQDVLITNSQVVDDQFVFFDRQKKQGLLVNADGQVSNSFSAENIDSEIKDVSVEFGLDTFWLLANDVFSLELDGNGEASTQLTDEERIPSSTIVAAFSNSLYLFNADERTIFKYTQDDDGFSDPTRWIRSVPGLDFEQIIDMMIDGDVWLSAKNGEIFRLRSGNRQDFSFSGLEKPFSSSVYMYSQEELENIYFLEPTESRVVITDKDGVFVREVTSSSLAAASHIVVSTDETKLLAVSGSTVYEIEL